MSEENKRNAELNEAELEGVSGGNETSPLSARESAIRYCSQCDKSSFCGCLDNLAKYLEGMGIDSLVGPQACPYYNG